MDHRKNKPCRAERLAVAYMYGRLRDAHRNLRQWISTFGEEHEIIPERRASAEQARRGLEALREVFRRPRPVAVRAKPDDARCREERLTDACLFLQHRAARRRYLRSLDERGSGDPHTRVLFAIEIEAWNALQGYRETMWRDREYHAALAARSAAA